MLQEATAPADAGMLDSSTVESSPVPPGEPVGRGGWLERRLTALLADADVRLDGDRPWDVRVLDRRLFARVARRGMLGLGDAYVDGWWECDALDEFFCRCVRAGLPARLPPSPPVLLDLLRRRLTNPQTSRRVWGDVTDHYDRGNDLFEAMLDPRMVYTCGHWSGGAATLAEAQEAKLDLVCRKIGLRPGQRVLDIGCGWGSFAQFAAERYGAEVVGVTLSGEQLALGRTRCAGLPVELRLCDYRAVDERFDHVVSLGMFEHVGPKNYKTYMRVARRCLRPGGLFLLHTFGSRHTLPNLRDSEVLWFERHIFPGLALPSMAQIGAAAERDFVIEDVHNFGADYDPTLMAWFANFERAWPTLRGRYGERFRRMWRFYLLCAAGAFRSRKYQLWQIVLSPAGVEGGYARVC